MARTYSSGDDNVARIGNNLAEALLDDLDLSGGQAGQNWTNARDISLAYNTYLKRAFGGEVLATNARGKSIIDDRLVTQKLFSGSPDAVAVRLDQIRKLGDLLEEYQPKFGTDPTGQPIVQAKEIALLRGDTDQVLDQALRYTIEKLERNTEFNPNLTDLQRLKEENKRIQQFKADNKYIFEIFSDIGKEIDEAGSISNIVSRMKDTRKILQEKINTKKAFAKLINSENPERAVEIAYKSENPTKEFESLTRLLDVISKSKLYKEPKRLTNYLKNKDITIDKETLKLLQDGNFLKQAKEGLRNSVMSYALYSGGKRGPQFNAKAAYDTLFDRMPNAKNDNMTLASFLVKNDLISEAEKHSLNAGLRKIITTETKKAVGDVVIQDHETPLIYDVYTRILGSRLGTSMGQMFGGRTSGSSMIEAHAGSRYLRKLTQELPVLQEYDALEKILLDPRLLAMALREPQSHQEKMSLIRMLSDGLKKYTLGAITPGVSRAIPLGAEQVNEMDFMPDVEYKLPELNSTIIEQSLGIVSNQDVDFAVKKSEPPRQVPKPLLTSQNIKPMQLSQAQPAATSGPVDRNKYAALFPNDMASSMIKGGIGGLMG
jgi:hypothetical protein